MHMVPLPEKRHCCRNGSYPNKGIDTDLFEEKHTCVSSVEMEVTRIRELTPVTSILMLGNTLVEMEVTRIRELTLYQHLTACLE